MDSESGARCRRCGVRCSLSPKVTQSPSVLKAIARSSILPTKHKRSAESRVLRLPFLLAPISPWKLLEHVEALKCCTQAASAAVVAQAAQIHVALRTSTCFAASQDALHALPRSDEWITRWAPDIAASLVSNIVIYLEACAKATNMGLNDPFYIQMKSFQTKVLKTLFQEARYDSEGFLRRKLFNYFHHLESIVDKAGAYQVSQWSAPATHSA
jgi:hypothetical protein